jgi:hypothetical protein
MKAVAELNEIRAFIKKSGTDLGELCWHTNVRVFAGKLSRLSTYCERTISIYCFHVLCALSAVERWQVDRDKLDLVIVGRAIYFQSFMIHGGVAGLYDYGPVAAAIEVG